MAAVTSLKLLTEGLDQGFVMHLIEHAWQLSIQPKCRKLPNNIDAHLRSTNLQ
jgi:hypothetical protein